MENKTINLKINPELKLEQNYKITKTIHKRNQENLQVNKTTQYRLVLDSSVLVLVLRSFLMLLILVLVTSIVLGNKAMLALFVFSSSRLFTW